MSNILMLTLLLLMSSCATPFEEWSPSDHAKVMQSCRKLCGKNRAVEYDIIDGHCKCSAK